MRTSFYVCLIIGIYLAIAVPLNVFTYAKYCAGGTRTAENSVSDKDLNCNHCQEGILINEENFPDPNFRSWLLKQDYGADGVITDDEIAGITSIDFEKEWDTPNEERISTLEGIQYFTALTTLSCGYNALTSLDVSNNTALTTLECYFNQLTSLEATKNTALTTLECYCNQLTRLDVTKNTALTTLECSYNALTRLDISKNTALTTLDCLGNQLTRLDVTKNTALTTLNCSNNQLTRLDVTKNTALAYLSCPDNQLTRLDVTKTRHWHTYLALTTS